MKGLHYVTEVVSFMSFMLYAWFYKDQGPDSSKENKIKIAKFMDFLSDHYGCTV